MGCGASKPASIREHLEHEKTQVNDCELMIPLLADMGCAERGRCCGLQRGPRTDRETWEGAQQPAGGARGSKEAGAPPGSWSPFHVATNLLGAFLVTSACSWWIQDADVGPGAGREKQTACTHTPRRQTTQPPRTGLHRLLLSPPTNYSSEKVRGR